jgi:hypothetical protein
MSQTKAQLIASPIDLNGAELTFPTTQGSAGQVLRNSSTAGTLEFANGGKILQVIQATETDIANSSTSTYADTGLTASITPSSSSNKVLVLAYEGQCSKTANDTQLDIQLLRGSTNIFTHTALNLGAPATTEGSNITICYLDSPATTSATTYKTQFRNRDASGTVRMNVNGTAVIILMEVEA